MDYRAAEEALREAGFEQIALNAIEDITASGDAGDRVVSSVSIDGSSDYTTESKFHKNAEVVISYHCVKRLESPISADEAKSLYYMEVGKQFFEAGFPNVETDEVYDLSADAGYETVVSVNGEALADQQIPFDAHISVIGHYPLPNYATSIAIDFESNWLFNKYDVVVSLNGEKLGDLDHGEDYTYELSLPKGDYQLLFAKETDDKVTGSASFTVNSDTAAEYHISCYGSEIKIEERGVTHSLTDDSLMLPYGSGHYLRKNWHGVVDELKALGFTKISAEPVKDHFWTPSSFDSVVAVKIDGTGEFEHDFIAKKAAPVTVQYHAADFAFKETAVNVTEKDSFEIPHRRVRRLPASGGEERHGPGHVF